MPDIQKPPDPRTVNPLDITIARKLRDARVKAGLSQHIVAEELGISFQQLQKYESGINRITASRLFQAAALLSVPIAYFADDTNLPAALDPPISEKAQSIATLASKINDPAILKHLIALMRSISRCTATGENA